MTAEGDGGQVERTPEKNPILNNPYDPPREYWELDSNGRATSTICLGRRPSAPYPTVPDAGGQQRPKTDAEFDMHKRINLIRERVDAWKNNGYPGIALPVKKLLEYWNNGEHHGMRPFFCQVVAIETLVWLCDVPESTDPKLAGIRAEISAACNNHNGEILRYATKMATGTGKTVVMGMIVAWKALRERGRTDILVMVPNLTVKDRLGVLRPSNEDNVYRDILPRDIRLPDDTRVTIINYQAFQPRSALGVGSDEQVDAKTRRLITAGQKEPDHWKESPAVMLDRLLPSHRGASKITVLNDEAHHCYRPDDPNARADKDEVVGPKEGALWFGALTHIRNEGRLGMIFDMSATPMFISSASKADTELFPWVVSDYPLIDAIEAGLTKIPRVPVKDQAGNDEPKFRNIYRYMRKVDQKLRHDSMHEDVKDLLCRLEEKYKEETKRYAKVDKIPVMIVVAYPIENAKAIYKHLAGYKEGGVWKGGYEMFSNIRDGKPTPTPATLLVTSNMDDLDDRDWKDLAIEHETFFSDKDDKKQRIEHIRETFQTVGRKGKPGEKIRCVVSVNMLTEGWDAKTVTHIFGYRPFKSDLLCEQVAGRALRRSGLPADGLADGQLLPPEYAGIFGIPFSFMLGDGGSRPPPPTWNVRTVEGREHLQMSFPNIRAYEIRSEITTFELDPKEVKPYKLARLYNKSGDVIVVGPTGVEEKLEDSKRAHSAIYELAEHITQKFAGKGVGKLAFFQSALTAVHEWLKHPKVQCDDVRLLAYPPNRGTAADDIWDACTMDRKRPPIRPIFADEHDSSYAHELYTSGVDFDTAKEHKYPTEGGIPAKSELSAAACDSADEVRVAHILDGHDGVDAWVRTERIGWVIPYMDPKAERWRDYTPDFVARLKGGDHLIIEFKGQDNKDAQIKKRETEEKWIPAVNDSDDPACKGTWHYVYLDNSMRIGNDLNEAIKGAIK